MADNHATVEELAVEQGLSMGRLLYLLHRPSAPRPERRGRETVYDRDEVQRHLRAHHWVMRC